MKAGARENPIRAKLILLSTLIVGTFWWGCQAGGWRNESHDLRRLEKELRGHGLVTIKRPDVWTENRLHNYRREFEAAFRPKDDPPFSDFKPTISATESSVQLERLGVMLDAAVELEKAAAGPAPKLSQFLATALLSGVDLSNPMAAPNVAGLLQKGLSAFLAQQSGIDPSIFTGGSDDNASGGNDGGNGNGNGGEKDDQSATSKTDGDDQSASTGEAGGDAGTGDAGGADSTGGSGGGEGGKKDDEEKGGDEEDSGPVFSWLLDPEKNPDLLKVPTAPDATLLSPFEIQAQKRAFVNQNHLFRIGNEPDDGTRMNGYSLYYMRFMVSVTPSGQTQKNHSAEILLSPRYDVLDATRDWLAQYVRGMLRERIMRTLEVGLEGEIGRTIHKHTKNLKDWTDMKERERIKEDVLDTLQPLVDDVNDKIKALNTASTPWTIAQWRAMRGALNSLQTIVKEKQARYKDCELDSLTSHLNALQSECERVINAIKDCQTGAEKLDELKPKLQKRSARANEVVEPLIDYMNSKNDELANALKVAAQHDQNSVGGIEKTISKLNTAKTLVPDTSDQQDLVDAIEMQVLTLEVKAELLKIESGKVTIRTGFSNILAKLKEIKTLLSTGTAFELLQRELAHDVGVKIRNDFAAKLRLATLAYDDYAREIDYRLGVPNAVDTSINLDKENNSVRVARASLLMKELLCWHTEEQHKPKDAGTQDEGNNKPQSAPASTERDTHDKRNEREIERPKCVSTTLQSSVQPIDSDTLDKLIQHAAKQLARLANGHRDRSRGARLLSRGLDVPKNKCPCTEKGNVDPDCVDVLDGIIGPSSPYKTFADGNNGGCDVRVSKLRLRQFFSPENWPIYTFAVAPFSEAENIGRAIDLNNELQILLKGAFKGLQGMSLKGAMEYARAIREQFRAVQVNRTVVGLVRGEQNFGWQINPPYRIPVKRRFDGSFKFDNAAEMPSRTYEVFALVAVPGFLRSMDLTVSYDWTAVQRADGTEIGTTRAMRYLRQFRHIQNRTSQWREGGGGHWWLDGLLSGRDYWEHSPYDDNLSSSDRLKGNPEDNLFIGELLDEHLAQVESSLPLRTMRRVMLPYSDVSERLTNTAGISYLQPTILRISPRYMPSHQQVVLTIEGKNFDTGRVEVIVGGVKATNVELANDHVIIATVPARKLMADLAVQTRSDNGSNKEFLDAQKTVNGRKLLHDLEGLLNVMVITPTGATSELALVRLTEGDPSPEPEKPKPDPKPKEKWKGKVTTERYDNGDLKSIEITDTDIDNALKILDTIKETLPPDCKCLLDVAGKGCVTINIDPKKN